MYRERYTNISERGRVHKMYIMSKEVHHVHPIRKDMDWIGIPMQSPPRRGVNPSYLLFQSGLAALSWTWNDQKTF